MTFLDEKKAAVLQKEPVNPPRFVRFMMSKWRPQPRALPKALPQAKAHAARRRALSKFFPGEVLVIPSGHEQVRANDTTFRFRPGSDFFYLTGNTEPDCVLVLLPGRRGHVAHLFVEPNPGRGDATFFTDRHKGELWVGKRLGVPQSRARFGVEVARPLAELPELLKASAKARVLRGLSPAVDAAVPVKGNEAHHKALATALSELRLLKDAAEVKALQQVIDATQRGFEDVIRSLKTAKSERTVEGTFALRAREEGQDVGYGIIAAAGANACVLHWTHNHGPLKKKELLLLDAGVEGHQLYTADITRTLPIGGRFTAAQREVYALVWQAHQAALAAVKPGNDFMEPNRRAMRVLAEGLHRMGILPTPVDEALDPEKQFYKRYTLHRISHMLGLDVHDCAKAREQVYQYGPLQPGMVLTIEPGLYFQLDDLTVPKRYRGIGVRIEDDVLVTRTGMKNLSGGIPSRADEVERWMRRVWRGR